MIGQVFGRQPRMDVPLRIPGMPDLQIEFVVDTGFDGFLSLPVAAITALNLTYDQSVLANLANDQNEWADLYQAVVVWDGAERQITVLALGGRPLLGTALMDGHDLNVRFADGRPVTVHPF